MRVFLDTGYLYARIDARDQWHTDAERAAGTDEDSVTSSLVVNETVTLLQNRRMFSRALDFLHRIRNHPDVRVIHVDPVLQAEAWALYGKWGASGATVVDCSSFAIMRSMGIRKAFTFDEHFRAAGFEILG